MRALLLSSLVGFAIASAAEAQKGRAVAVRAGTVHTVGSEGTLSNGTILIRGAKIVEVGEGIEIPGDATIVDYGPDAVIVPGFVAAMSYYANGSPSKRTADPDVRAVEGFDPYRKYYDALSAGVTSAYVSPSDRRLIAGQGALVKLAGGEHEKRIVNGSAAIHGAVDRSARSAPGYWEPPVPVTVDVGIGSQLRQLPKTTMGAIVALDELVAAGRNGVLDSDYGPRAPGVFVRLLDSGVPLRLGAVEQNEIRAVLDFALRGEVEVILDKANEAGALAEEIAAAGVGVIYRVPYTPNTNSFDRGKDEDSRWYTFDAPARLRAAGATVAITGSNPRDLLFVAGLATRGGLSDEDALRAITLTPAEMLGGDARIGSLSAGKDADLCVLNGAPLSGQAGVLATWVDGEKVWWYGMAETSRSSKRRATRRVHARAPTTVIEVDELHVGDGEVLRPGQILLRDGKIAEVSERVSHPVGASVVRGKAAMPGMIDAFGHLGLEGSKKVPKTDFAMKSIVDPGDEVDRRVATYGITTVVLTPRAASGTGSPVMAYKPAAENLENQVIGDPVALRLRWRESARIHSGSSVAKLLEKALGYRTKWEEYEKAIAAWVPPVEKPEKEDEEAVDEEEGKEEAEKDDKKKKKKKRKKGEKEELEPDPLTGEWVGELESARLRLRLLFENPGGSGPVEGTLRCDALSDTLIDVEGTWDLEQRELVLQGSGSRGSVELALHPKEGKLEGEIAADGETHEVELERKSKEYPVARRPERRAVATEKKKAPRGKPKAPKRDAKLEPIVRAMSGEVTIVIEVQRDDEISECVALFARYGIRPVLYGAEDAHLIAAQIAGKVAGILLSPSVLVYEAERGSEYRAPYSDLQQAGIPVAFLSESEEGAIDLPLRAAFAVASGMSPDGAVRALTSDAASMMSIDHRVGRLAAGLDADVVLLDGPPMAPGTSVVRTWVNGEEIRP
jgi:imidazolonepropionase-like amidohydrolase